MKKYYLPALTVFAIIILYLCFVGCALASDFIPKTEKMVSELADAIYHAENSAIYPYGIKSIPCKGKDECRRICMNTIRNNIKRWRDAGRKEDYLLFLRNKYAPQNVKNDPFNLNDHWLWNVQWFLDNPKEVK